MAQIMFCKVGNLKKAIWRKGKAEITKAKVTANATEK